MEIILSKDVDGLGKAGSVIKVKDGFASNYLLPRGLAMAATSANLRKVEAEKKKRGLQAEKVKAGALALKEKLAELSITIAMAVNEEEKLYAAISAQDIARSLNDEGYDIDKSIIALDEPIKALGIYEVAVKLHPEVSARVKVWIVKK